MNEDHDIQQVTDATPLKEKASVTTIRASAKYAADRVAERIAKVSKRLKDKTPMSLAEVCALLDASMAAMKALDKVV